MKKKDKAVLTTAEVAEYFQIHPLTIQRYAREGILPAFKIGSDWRFHKKQLDKWVKERSRYKSGNNTSLFVLFFCLLACLTLTSCKPKNSPPAAGTVTPASGSSYVNQPVNFAAIYTDANGLQDLLWAAYLGIEIIVLKMANV